MPCPQHCVYDSLWLCPLQQCPTCLCAKLGKAGGRRQFAEFPQQTAMESVRYFSAEPRQLCQEGEVSFWGAQEGSPSLSGLGATSVLQLRHEHRLEVLPSRDTASPPDAVV